MSSRENRDPLELFERGEYNAAKKYLLRAYKEDRNPEFLRKAFEAEYEDVEDDDIFSEIASWTLEQPDLRDDVSPGLALYLSQLEKFRDLSKSRIHLLREFCEELVEQKSYDWGEMRFLETKTFVELIREENYEEKNTVSNWTRILSEYETTNEYYESLFEIRKKLWRHYYFETEGEDILNSVKEDAETIRNMKDSFRYLEMQRALANLEDSLSVDSLISNLDPFAESCGIASELKYIDQQDAETPFGDFLAAAEGSDQISEVIKAIICLNHRVPLEPQWHVSDSEITNEGPGPLLVEPQNKKNLILTSENNYVLNSDAAKIKTLGQEFFDMEEREVESKSSEKGHKVEINDSDISGNIQVGDGNEIKGERALSVLESETDIKNKIQSGDISSPEEASEEAQSMLQNIGQSAVSGALAQALFWATQNGDKVMKVFSG